MCERPENDEASAATEASVDSVRTGKPELAEDATEPSLAQPGAIPVAAVIAFPKPFRAPLPSDAIPKGKDRHVDVFPCEGAWCVLESDEGGGCLDGPMSKEKAMEEALMWVLEFTATLEVHNRDIYERTGVA